LGATGLEGVVELVPPFPDIRFGGGNDRELDALVEHDTFPCGQIRAEERNCLVSINPGNYGSDQFIGVSLALAAMPGAVARGSVNIFAGHFSVAIST
jgi:hypothetical protein